MLCAWVGGGGGRWGAGVLGVRGVLRWRGALWLLAVWVGRLGGALAWVARVLLDLVLLRRAGRRLYGVWIHPMTRRDTNPLDESWPPHELETVCACPYCASGNRTLAYPDVQDWSFGVAAGRWSYWRCGDCHALFLDPRPGAASIARAYGRYYTHGAAPQPTWVAAFKQGLRNEYWSHRFATPVLPRLGLPRWIGPVFGLLKPWVAGPFGLWRLAALTRGLVGEVVGGGGAGAWRASGAPWPGRPDGGR